MSDSEHEPELTKELNLTESRRLAKKLLDDHVTMVLESDLPRFKPFVYTPEKPIDFIKAKMVFYKYRICKGIYRYYYNFDDYYNDFIKDGSKATPDFIDRLHIEIKIISQKEFQTKMIRQKLKDFKEQWEYYRKVLCTRYKPDRLFKEEVISLEETDIAWSIYEDYKYWKNKNQVN